MKAEFKRKLIVTLVAPALGLAVAGSSLAADRTDDAKHPSSAAAQRDSSDKGGTTARSAAQDLRASKLIGATVKNAQGENLGKIDDLIVDVNNERIYYAVLASGGVMGLGGKLFAYPVSLFRPGADKDELALNVDKDRLKNAPGFDKKSWPEWGGSGDKDKYRSEVDKYFGPTVTAKSMPNERLVRASTLIGKDIDDREGKDAGEIKDLVVSLGTGRVAYAVMAMDNNWMKSDRLMPISLKAFSFSQDKDKDLVLNVAKNQLDPNKGFDKDKWADLDINDPAFKRDMDRNVAAMSASGRTGAAGQAAGTRRATERSETRDRSDKE